MTGRRVALGISVLCALAFGAVAVASASAAPTGYTAFTCEHVAPGTGNFQKPHCLPGDGGIGDYTHHPVTTVTTISVTNANTASETKAAQPSVFKGAISGVQTTVVCTGLGGSGKLENKINGEEMYVEVTELIITYTGCTVTAPAGKGCIVKEKGVTGEGVIVTNKLTATTKEQGMDLQISRSGEAVLALIPIEGCAPGPAKGTYPLGGSLKVTEIEASGGTLTTTHAEITTQNTVTLAGQKAGLEGSLTLKGTSGDALTVTTPPYSE